MNKNIEKDLIKKAQEDKNAYGELYNYFVQDVYRYTYSILLDRQKAEDVTSQTFLVLFTKIHDYKITEASLKSWLFTTSRNIIYKSYIRNKKDYESYDENIQPINEYEISFVDQIINEDLLDKIQATVEKELKPNERELIVLRIWEGISFKEIANIQSESLETTKKRFYRSIDKVRDKLRKDGHMQAVSLPFLFTGMNSIKSSKTAYHNPDLHNTSPEITDYLKEKIMESKDIKQNKSMESSSNNLINKAFISTGVKLTAGVLGVIMILIPAGYAGYRLMQEDTGLESTQESTLLQRGRDTAEQNLDRLPTLRPTVIDDQDDPGRIYAYNGYSRPVYDINQEVELDVIDTEDYSFYYPKEYLTELELDQFIAENLFDGESHSIGADGRLQKGFEDYTLLHGFYNGPNTITSTHQTSVFGNYFNIASFALLEKDGPVNDVASLCSDIDSHLQSEVEKANSDGVERSESFYEKLIEQTKGNSCVISFATWTEYYDQTLAGYSSYGIQTRGVKYVYDEEEEKTYQLIMNLYLEGNDEIPKGYAKAIADFQLK